MSLVTLKQFETTVNSRIEKYKAFPSADPSFSLQTPDLQWKYPLYHPDKMSSTTPERHKYECVHHFLDEGLSTSECPSNPECPICQEPYPPSTPSHNKPDNSPSTNSNPDRHIQTKDCGHSFHLSCLIRWLEAENHNTCPSCRYELFRPSPPSSQYGDEDDDSYEDNDVFDALEHAIHATEHLGNLLDDRDGEVLEEVRETAEWLGTQWAGPNGGVLDVWKRILPAGSRARMTVRRGRGGGRGQGSGRGLERGAGEWEEALGANDVSGPDGGDVGSGADTNEFCDCADDEDSEDEWESA